MRQSFALLSIATLATSIVPSSGTAATKTCSSTQACRAFNNTSTGSGVEGEADKGIGVRGIAAGGTGVRGYATTGIGVSGSSTKASGVSGFSSSGTGASGSSSNGAGVAGTSASGTFNIAGVMGANTNHTGHDSAATFGYGNYPAYGMLGYGTTYGAFGETENAGTSSPGGYAVAGMDTLGSASADYNTALLGYSTHGTGLLAEAGGTPNQGLIGIGFPIGGYFVGNSAGGRYPGIALGIVAESDDAPISAINTSNSPPGSMGDDFVSLATPTDLIMGTASGGSFDIDNSGNLTVSGTIMQNGDPSIRTRGASGVTTIAYGERSTAPAIEDVGEAQLSNGRSFVRIDKSLADAIDRRGAYHVFLTPEGDCNGLFVSQKSPRGFAVSELRGGRSTLAFDYRIVAKPLDNNGARLGPAPAIRKRSRLFPALSRRRMLVPLTPEQQARRSTTLP